MLEENTIKRFVTAFTGLDRAYGRYQNGRAKTTRKPPSFNLYKKHLEGTSGLGIVPINDAAHCMFGAIDIDINDIDHTDLEKRIKGYQIPGIVCRSKSGGAHVYTFFQSPGIPASVLRDRLSGYAAKLGYGNSEIFPKQDRLQKDDVGNWINLPYFSNEGTNRYAIFDGKPVKLQRFLDMVDAVRNTNNVDDDTTVKDHGGHPPCLVHVLEHGIPNGHRNEIMFNLAVYLKRSNPDLWEDQFNQANYDLCEKPLSKRELDKIIKSVNRKDYSYKCEEPYAKTHCDRLRCQQLKYGVGKVEEVYSELVLGCLTKIKTDPPRWILDFNGLDVELTTEQLMTYKNIRILALEKLNLVVSPMKPEDWMQIVKQKLLMVKEVIAPDDATRDGQLSSMFFDFASLARRVEDRNAILRGVPVRGDKDGLDVIFFRSNDFIQFLKRKKFTKTINNQDLWMNLRRFGCQHTKIKVSGKTTQVWFIHRDDNDSPQLYAVDTISEGDDF